MTATKHAPRRSASIVTAESSEEVLAEREEARARSVKAVQRAIYQRQEQIEFSRPLRRFGCQLTVALHHHTIVKGRTVDKRKLVVMSDKITLESLHDWVEGCLGLKKDATKSMILQYEDRHGAGELITKRTLKKWLDDMWDMHPPRLHLFSGEKMVQDVEDREERLRELFSTFDVNGDGEISLDEAQAMLKAMGLSQDLDVSDQDVAAFAAHIFGKADANGSGGIGYDEYVGWYNSMAGFMKAKLKSSTKVLHNIREEFIEARAANGLTLERVVNELHGLVTLDANGHDYGIEVRFSASCLTGGNAPGAAVACRTLLESKVAHFQDHTPGRRVEHLCSPVVEVAVAGGLQHGEITVLVPHSLSTSRVLEEEAKIQATLEGRDPGDGSLSKDDLIVAYAESVETGAWSQIPEDAYELLPGEAPSWTVDEIGPLVRVTLQLPGIVAVFSRRGKDVPQRVQLMAFLPSKIIPIERDILRVYACPCHPSAIEEVRHAESVRRGVVDLGGVSEPFDVFDERTVVGISIDQGDGAEHQRLVWSSASEIGSCEFEFDPSVFMSALEHARDQENATETCDSYGGVINGKLAVKFSTSTAKIGQKRHFHNNEFEVGVRVHDFPPPSEPLLVRLTCRNNGFIKFAWDLPAMWGGCALSQYEIQLREQTVRGEWKEWTIVYRGDARETEGGADRNPYACEVQVRAYNVGEAKPGPWSKVLYVAPTREEEATARIQAQQRGKLARREAQAKKDKGAAGGASAEGKVAVVQSEVEFKRGMGSLRDLHKQNTCMKGWSPFKSVVGAMFVEIGVRGGVDGKLFDLTVEQVEGLLEGNQTDTGAISADEPLMTMACAGVWVLETLAHYAEDSDTWILFMNDVDGLLGLAAEAYRGADMAMDAWVKEIILTLHEVYETLRQCEEGGYIQLQLGYRYDKALKKQLKADWKARIAELKQRIAVAVMHCVLMNRQKHVGRGER